MIFLLRGNHLSKGRVWVLYDSTHTMIGETGESQNAIRKRWTAAHGEITQLTRYKGVMRWSEAVMSISSHQHPRKT